MRITRPKLFIFAIIILLPFLLFVLFKKKIVLNNIKSTIRNSGGEISISHLSAPLFSNFYTFTGVIQSENSDIRLDKISRDYFIFSFSESPKKYKFLKIEGGELKIKKIGTEKTAAKLPSFSLVTIKNFEIILPNINENIMKILIDDLEVHDLSLNENRHQCSYIKLLLAHKNLKLKVDSEDGKTFRFESKHFNIVDLHPFLPSYTSIITDADFSVIGEFKSPELQMDGHLKISLKVHNYKLKEKVNLFETLYKTKLESKLEQAKADGLNINISILKENFNKNPFVILQEHKAAVVSQIYSQLLGL